ncbi:heterokaryon incompatibility protein-domain-containing protein [Phlebopus sp. FC_14]|nr:heterokaryon incompatibility protein-domain-containing protein [Phlebopus sp. FC_14]
MHPTATTYAPLSAHCFRLLTILPAPPNHDELHCTLSVHSLTSPPPYTALSQNLYDALFHIRRDDAPVALWADAICINQNDLDERMDQVSHMHTIYKNAAEVIVWLGLPSDDSSLALAFVFELPDLLAKAKSAGTAQQFLHDPSFMDRWVALGHLLMRSWWRRVWIIQEIALARTARIFVGAHSIPWSVMHALLNELRRDWQWALHADVDRDIATVIRLASQSRSIFDILASFRAVEQSPPPRPADLGALMKITYQFKSTDPRDKVYALLGLTDDHARTYIQPDYRKHCNANDSFSWMLNNPVPWIDGTDPANAKPWRFYRTGDPILAGLPSTHDMKFSDDRNEMVVPGVQVDKITHMDPYMLFDLHDYVHNQAPTPQIVEKLRAEAEGGVDTDTTPYIAGGNSRSAFYRTLLLDCQVPYIGPNSAAPRRLQKSEPLVSLVHIPPKSAQEVDTLLHAMSESLGLFHGRCFTVTGMGYVGVAPRTANIGDWVCVLLGGELPFVLREMEDGHFRMVGECFLQGIMDGEIMEQVRCRETMLRDFVIR